ncbi:NUDIX domain-containing protein [Candidatus Peribacteria bacterium]|nr:NUDIX domain-containing protein [Candidatus Peribacteria bacterium]
MLFQKRCNTGFRDGLYQLPSGHMEGRETMKEAMIRELTEELSIHVTENDLTIVHISHTIAGDRVYFNIYMEVSHYTGELTNCETEKCSEISFHNIEEIAGKAEFQYEFETLEKIFQDEKFSEKNH